MTTPILVAEGIGKQVRDGPGRTPRKNRTTTRIGIVSKKFTHVATVVTRGGIAGEKPPC